MVVDCPTGLDEQIEISNEVLSNAMVQRPRGRTMGKELEWITRGLCMKIRLDVAEGKRRLEALIQAAKLASESGVIVRNHVPILPHWKEYKDKGKAYVDDYMGKIAGQFTIDVDDKTVKNACIGLLKGLTRQLRHKLKKAFFDGVPADKMPTKSPVSSLSDEQWRALAELWSSAKHKEKMRPTKGTGRRFGSIKGQGCGAMLCKPIFW